MELNTPVSEVWVTIGDPGRMPEYSAGLRKVDAKHDGSGKCAEYTCHFLPVEEGEQETLHTEIIKWYEPNRGWASSAEDPNKKFGGKVLESYVEEIKVNRGSSE